MQQYTYSSSQSIVYNAETAIDRYISRINSFSNNARLFLLYAFLTSLNFGVYGVVFNLYILRLGFREDFLGLILSAISISTGLFSIPAAMICNRIGRKKTLLTSCLLLTVSLIFLYTATSANLLLFFSTLYGISSALNVVTGSTFLMENSGNYERMHLFSIYHVLYTTASMIGNIAGGVLPKILMTSLNTDPAGPAAYQLSLYASLTAVLISFLPLAFIKDNKTEWKGSSDQLKTLLSLIRSRTIQRMILVYSLVGMGWGMALPFFNVYFDIVLNASSDQIGMIFSLSQITMMIALLFVPMLTERFGKVTVISLVQLSSIPFLLLFTSSSVLAIVAFAYIMRSTLMNMANPILSSFRMEIVSEKQRATVNSVTWTSCYIFVGLSTYVGGHIMTSGDYALPFLVTCVLYAMAAILYYMFFEKVERQQNSTDLRDSAQGSN